MSRFAPTSATNCCRRIASFGDVPLQTITALAIDAARSVVAVGQYAYPQTGVALLDLGARTIRWRSDWEYSTHDDVSGLAFSQDGRRLWIALSRGGLRCHGVTGGELLTQTAECGGDDISDVRLSRDARWAIVSGSYDRSPGYGAYPPVDFNEYFTTVIAADADEGDARPSDTEVNTVLATSPGRNTLLRFRDAATLAVSPDRRFELFSVVKGHEAAPQLLLRERVNSRILDTLAFHRPGDFALAATFTDDGDRFFAGTHSGLLFEYALVESNG